MRIRNELRYDRDSTIILITENSYTSAFLEAVCKKMFMQALVEEWKAYQQMCYTDTITATKFEDGCLIDHGFYREVVSGRQLNNRGYEYRYRWVIKTDPFEFEYIFTKEPTIKGFMKYLEKKLK